MRLPCTLETRRPLARLMWKVHVSINMVTGRGGKDDFAPRPKARGIRLVMRQGRCGVPPYRASDPTARRVRPRFRPVGIPADTRGLGALIPPCGSAHPRRTLRALRFRGSVSTSRLYPAACRAPPPSGPRGRATSRAPFQGHHRAASPRAQLGGQPQREARTAPVPQPTWPLAPESRHSRRQPPPLSEALLRGRGRGRDRTGSGRRASAAPPDARRDGAEGASQWEVR